MSLLQIDPTKPDVNIIRQVNIILKLAFGDECCVGFGNQVNYVLIEGENVVAYCTVTQARLLFDPENKYHEMTLPMDLMVRTDFTETYGEVVYNLARRPGEKYKGSGLMLLDKIIKERGILMLSAEHDKLRKYYQDNGFKSTNMYDISSSGVGQKVMFKKN